MSNAPDAVSTAVSEFEASGWDDLPGSPNTDSPSDASQHLSDLSDFDADDGEDSAETKESDSDTYKVPKEENSEDKKPPSESTHIEFKALGKTHKVPKPTDEQLPILLSKAFGADQKMKAADARAKDAEAKLAEANQKLNFSGKAVDIERASRLAKLGHSREAVLELSKALGEEGTKILEAFLEDERAYAKADPSQRLVLDAERKSRAAEIAKLTAEEQIAQHNAKLEADSENARRTQYSGYISDAFTRYDLSQWIENADVANSLNQTLKDASMNALGREQRQREAAGKPDLSQIEIRQIVARQAKLLHGSYANTVKKETSADAVESKSKTAEQQMQEDAKSKADKNDLNRFKGMTPTQVAEAMYGKSRNRF